MYSILATALLCLWIWLVSVASPRIRKMPTFSILTLATLAYCVQTMLEVSRTVDLLTGKVIQDRERPVAIVFFLFAVPWISDWTFVPRLLAFFPSTIHRTRKRLLVIALPVAMKIVRAVFIALFTLHTYQTTHGPPLDETTFYHNIAFSTSFPQLEWIAIIVDEGYCTAFLIAHLMLFRRGHIRSQPLLSAVRTVILASVATFALPLAFCCTSISLQYAHMNPKVTRDAWVAAEFVIVLGAYGSCVAPTIRSEQLAKRALNQRQAVTPDISDTPQRFVSTLTTPRTNGVSRMTSSRGKMETQSVSKSSPGDRSVFLDVEMGSLSFSHFKDTPPTSSGLRPVYSDGVEIVHSTPPRPLSSSEHDMGSPSSPDTRGTGMSPLLKKSNSLKSLCDLRHESTPPDSPDLTFRLKRSVRGCAAHQAQHIGRLAATQEADITSPLAGKTSDMAQNRPVSKGGHFTDITTGSEAVEVACRKESQDSDDKVETVVNLSEQGQRQCNNDRPVPGTPQSLHSPVNRGSKATNDASSALIVRPWTSTGASGQDSSFLAAHDQPRSMARQDADITEVFTYAPVLAFDHEMPFAANFAPSSPCRHSDSELRKYFQQQTHQQESRSQPLTPKRRKGDFDTDSQSYGLFSASEVLLTSPTRRQGIRDGVAGDGGHAACSCDWTGCLHKDLPAKPDSAVATTSSSPSTSSNPASQLSPPSSAGGIVRKGKLLAINTAIANKFLLRPGSANPHGTLSFEGVSGDQSQKRRSDKEPVVALAAATGRFSPTNCHPNGTTTSRRGFGGKSTTIAPHCSPHALSGHLEIAMQRTTRVDYACDEEYGPEVPGPREVTS